MIRKKKKKKKTGKKKKEKPATVTVAVIVLLAYILFITLPYIPVKKVGPAIKNSFTAEDCYSEEEGTERVMPVFFNREAMVVHLRVINEAKERLIVSTHQILADEAGMSYLAALMEAADRGVKVELITNGLNEIFALKTNPYMQAFASHENIAFYIYNPVRVLKPWKVQAALHSKYVIMDEDCYILGGRNLFNLFIGDYSARSNKDSELLVYEAGGKPGESMQQLLEYHKEIMGVEDIKPYRVLKKTKRIDAAGLKLKERAASLREEYPESYTSFDWTLHTVPTNKVTLLKSEVQAENKSPELWYYLNELSMTGNEVVIYTPYIICGHRMYADLKQLADKTEEVCIVTNAVENGANPFGCSDYLNEQKRIRSTGVKVYEFSGTQSLHTKAYCIDDRMSIIGSSNMDMRSVYIDTELMLAVDSRELNAFIRKDIKDTLDYCRTKDENGKYIYGDSYIRKKVSLPRRLALGILRLTSLITRRYL